MTESLSSPQTPAPDRYQALWEQRYHELLAYCRRHKDCHVPRRSRRDASLGEWCHLQRRYRRQGKLSPERIARLDALGFVWEPQQITRQRQEQQWERRLRELKRYQRRTGQSEPLPDAKPKLHTWLDEQRKLYRSGQLPADRAERLRALGLELAPIRYCWADRLAQLKAFQARHGHANIRLVQPEDRGLARWVVDTERRYRRGQLSAPRRAAWQALGLRWRPMPHPGAQALRDQMAELWEQRYQELRAFHREHGHIRIPKRSPHPLGRWLDTQRRFAREGHLSPERRRRLDALGMDWRPRAAGWQANYQALLALAQDQGYAQMHVSDAELARWQQQTQWHFEHGKLAPEQHQLWQNLQAILPPDEAYNQKLRQQRRQQREQARQMIVAPQPGALEVQLWPWRARPVNRRSLAVQAWRKAYRHEPGFRWALDHLATQTIPGFREWILDGFLTGANPLDLRALAELPRDAIRIVVGRLLATGRFTAQALQGFESDYRQVLARLQAD